MHRFNSLISVLTLASASLLAGCIVVHDHNNNQPLPNTCSVPAPVVYSSNFPAFHVLVNANSPVIPAGDGAYAVTSNGNGTYRLAWTDNTGLSSCFSGRITGIDNFNASQVTGLSGLETISLIAPNQIGFASIPGSTVDGVDFFAQQDPIYVDVYDDNSQSVNIYYTDGTTTLPMTTGANPAAFLSP